MNRIRFSAIYLFVLMLCIAILLRIGSIHYKYLKASHLFDSSMHEEGSILYHSSGILDFLGFDGACNILLEGEDPRIVDQASNLHDLGTIDSLSASYLAYVPTQNHPTSIRELQLNGCTMEFVRWAVGVAPKAIKVTVIGCEGFSSEHLTMFNKLKQLTELNIELATINQEGVETIAQLTNLRVIHLHVRDLQCPVSLLPLSNIPHMKSISLNGVPPEHVLVDALKSKLPGLSVNLNK